MQPYLDDDEELQVFKKPIKKVMTIGRLIRDLLTEQKWQNTQLPRIPVPIARDLMEKLKENPPNIIGVVTEDDYYVEKHEIPKGAPSISDDYHHNDERYKDRRRSRSPREYRNMENQDSSRSKEKSQGSYGNDHYNRREGNKDDFSRDSRREERYRDDFGRDGRRDDRYQKYDRKSSRGSGRYGKYDRDNFGRDERRN
ncbi:hypothetical protein HK096_003206 [Nowakowskiella sp. JEL0078]|nr:hypothetical protein HK096_003206 [Nowakowskiella sp. JEL0078]